MVPQLSLPFPEVFSLYTYPFFPKGCIPLLSLLLTPESWSRGALQGANGSPLWVGGCRAFWAAPETHRLERDTSYHQFPRRYGRSSFGDIQELQYELFGMGRIFWHASSKCEFPFLCRTGTPKSQPCSENIMENWLRTDHSEFQLHKLEDIGKQRNIIFI